MKSIKLTFIAVLLFVQLIQAADEQRIADINYTTIMNVEYDSRLMLQDLLDGVKWDASKEVLPLQPEDASKAASRMAEAVFPGKIEVTVRGISLVRHQFAGSWYYRVEVVPRLNGSNQIKPLVVFVTLSGQVGSISQRQK